MKLELKLCDNCLAVLRRQPNTTIITGTISVKTETTNILNILTQEDSKNFNFTVCSKSCYGILLNKVLDGYTPIKSEELDVIIKQKDCDKQS